MVLCTASQESGIFFAPYAHWYFFPNHKKVVVIVIVVVVVFVSEEPKN